MTTVHGGHSKIRTLKKPGGVFRLAVLVALVAASQIVQPAQAQNYPNRPIHIVVGTAPGGGTDTSVRMIQTQLQEKLGVPIVIDNRPGGTNQIAVQAVTNAVPDGYTLLAGTPGMLTINPVVFSKLSYDTMRDLVPISIISKYPMVAAVNVAVPVKTIKELSDHIKVNPNKANVGGTGSMYALTNKLFEMRTGVKTQFVPYKGGSETLTGLTRGDTLLAFVEAPSATAFLKGGLIRALAVLANQRLVNYPNIPTMAEAGIKGFDIELWTGLLAPAGTPPAIVQKLNEAIVAVVQSDEARMKMANFQQVPVGNTSGEFGAELKRLLALWGDVARTTHYKIQN